MFRYDIFISYARKDGKEYALKLRDQLEQLDFSCFLDLDELPPGNSLNKTLKRAIKKSATLVVVGTECAVKSRYVELELGEFASTHRAIIPINIEGTLAETPWPILKERDLVWIDEAKADLSKGVPSPTIADSIDKLFKYTRRNSRVRAQVLSTIVLFVVVVAFSFFLIQRQVNAATRATAEAKRQTVEASNQKKAAAEATIKANIAEGNANTALVKAATAEKAARDAATEAKKQEGIALVNAARAKEQQQIAEERTNYLRAQQMGVQADIDIDRGNDLERSVLLSVESLKRALTPDASIAWARGMELLPHAQEVNFADRRDDVTAVAYSPDGRFFAQGTKDGTVMFLRRDKRAEPIKRQLQPSYPIKVITFGMDWVGAANGEGYTIWELNTFEELRSSKTIEKFHGEASIAFSPDGRYVATGDSGVSPWLRVVDTIKSATVIDTAIEGLSYLLSVAFSPNGKWLAIASHYSPDHEANRIRPRDWSTTQGRLTFLKVANFDKGLEIATQPVDSVALDEKIDRVTFGPMGNHLATEGQDGVVSVWEVSDNDEHIELTRLRWPKTKIVGEGTGANSGYADQMFSWDESYLATAPDDSTARVWEVSSGREVARVYHAEVIENHYSPSIAVAFSPDAQFATSRGNVSFWKAEFGGEARRISFENELSAVELKALAVSPGGKWLAIGNNDGVRVFRIADWSQIAWLKEIDQADQLTFSFDDQWLIAAGRGEVTVIETRRWQARILPSTPPSPRVPVDYFNDEFPDALALGFSPDGRWLVRAYDNVVSVFEVGSWKERTIMTDKPVSRLAFSQDSRRLGVWVQKRRDRHLFSQDELFLWETASGTPVACIDDDETPPANVPGQPPDFHKGTVCSKVQGAEQSVSLSQASEWKAPLEFNLIPSTSPDGLWSIRSSLHGLEGIELYLNEGKTRRQVATLMQGINSRFRTFTPNSDWLVVAEDKMIKLWPLNPADMIAAACVRLRRHELTDSEWQFSDKKLHPCSLKRP